MRALVVANSCPVFNVGSPQSRSANERVVTASAEIMADRRQLAYALTLPEYLEAWIAPPDADTNHELVATRSGTAYSIDYLDLHGQAVRIGGAFRASSRDRVTLTWCRYWPNTTRPSVVSMRLLGKFAFTSLTLTHSGVMGDSEYRWLRDLWDRSLVRLRSLVGRRDSQPVHSNPREDRVSTGLH